MPIKEWDEITHPIPNLNDATVEVRQSISNFIPHILMDVITYAGHNWLHYKRQPCA